MTHRRTVLAALTSGLAATAGCGFILGNDSLSFSATPVTVSDETLENSEYSEVALDPNKRTKTFDTPAGDRDVEVTNQIARYERVVSFLGVTERKAAVMAVLSSPKVEIGDESFNPIEDMSTEELLSRAGSQYEGLSVGSKLDEQSLRILGSTETVKKYDGTATLSGSGEVDVYVHATEAFPDQSDFVFALAIYPQQVDGEQQRAFTLLKNLQHES